MAKAATGYELIEHHHTRTDEDGFRYDTRSATKLMTVEEMTREDIQQMLSWPIPSWPNKTEEG